MSLSCRASLLTLPEELLREILRHTGKCGGLPALLAMRSVSRACRTAVSTYDAHLTVSIRHNRWPVLSLQRMLPNLASVTIECRLSSLDVWPLSACSNLSSLSIKNDHHFRGDLQLDLSSLPSSLNYLAVTGAQILLFPLQVQFTRLENLTVQWNGRSGQAVSRLLKQLPRLQVILLPV